MHNNHVDKIILTNKVEILKTCTQPTTFYIEVKAHINIQRNEQADKLVKIGAKKYTSSLKIIRI